MIRQYNADLIEVRIGFTLAHVVEVADVDDLEVESESGVCGLILGQLIYVTQISELLVPPAVEIGDGATGTACNGGKKEWDSPTNISHRLTFGPDTDNKLCHCRTGFNGDRNFSVSLKIIKESK